MTEQGIPYNLNKNRQQLSTFSLFLINTNLQNILVEPICVSSKTDNIFLLNQYYHQNDDRNQFFLFALMSRS